MPNATTQIELLTFQAARDKLSDFIELLQDAVDSGASVGFLPPLSREVASNYWLSIFEDLDAGHRLLLGAMDGAKLVGSVQLELARKPNAAHRAEVQRLLVHRSVRRRGIGERLMRELEDRARQHGRTLLVLDTRHGDPSELLYQKLGYVRAGVIPGYARSAGGSLDPTAFYYRETRAGTEFTTRSARNDVPVLGSPPPGVMPTPTHVRHRSESSSLREKPPAVPATRAPATERAIQSLLIPGLGQFAQRRFLAGAGQLGTVLAYAVTAVALGGSRAVVFALAWNIWSAIDAYRHERP